MPKDIKSVVKKTKQKKQHKMIVSIFEPMTLGTLDKYDNLFKGEGEGFSTFSESRFEDMLRDAA